MTAKRRAPAGLKQAGKRLWDAVTVDYVLEAHEVELLVQACHCADKMDGLQRQIDKDGLMARRSLTGPVQPHPLMAELRAQQTSYTRLLRAMRLPTGLTDGTPIREHATQFEMHKRRLRRVGGA
jgi:hypothetical protein